MKPAMTDVHRSHPNLEPNPKVTLSDPLQYINPAVIKYKNAIISDKLKFSSRLTNQNIQPSFINANNAPNNVVKKQPNQETYKTVMCQAWLESSRCQFGDNCKFAHGEQELRPMKTQIRNAQKYKTKLCEKYTTTGICPYGNRCLFIHPDPRDPLHHQFYHLSQLAQMALQQLQQSHQVPKHSEYPTFHQPQNFHAQNGHLNRRMSYPATTPFSSDIWLYTSSSASNSSSSRASLNGSPHEGHKFGISPPKFGQSHMPPTRHYQHQEDEAYDPFMFENDALARDMVNILKIE